MQDTNKERINSTSVPAPSPIMQDTTSNKGEISLVGSE
jgi:hypothetical protein